jgi:phosphohistidine swiveling domain-containing protein
MRCLQGKLGVWAISNGKYMEAFLPKEQFIQSARLHLELQKKDPYHIVKIMRSCDRKAAQITEFYKQLGSIHKMNVKQVQYALKRLDALNYDYWCSIYHCDFYDPSGEELLFDEMKTQNLKLTDKEVSILLKSNWRNYLQEERIALLNLRKKYRSNASGKAIEKDLAKHAETYFYINNSWESTVVLGKEYFMKQIELMENIEDSDREVRRLNTDWELVQQELQKKYSISQEMMNIFFYFRQLFIMRDKRKKQTLLTNYYYDQLFLRLSELMNVPFKDMAVLLVEDVVNNIKQIKNKIALRKSLVIEVYSGTYSTNSASKSTFKAYKSNPSKSSKVFTADVFSGGDAVGIFNQLQKCYGVSGNLRGQSASKGKATGIARVIIGETHFSKFNDGEIIIAPMTRPEFVPLMKKASAIVTDEGGITCHAAIVSRELGIPCIVGTQKATSKLKDGMLIEVNADRGVVKIIKHMKLVTVQSLVNKEMDKHPLLVGVLKEGLLNITAAAEKFRPMIAQQLGKDVDVNAVGMAIRRYSKKL